jgi:hypothetical protein
MAVSTSNMRDSRLGETRYICTETDSAGEQLHGENLYAITFANGGDLPTVGFWSITLYNEHRCHHSNRLDRHSIHAKCKNHKFNADGSLTIYAGWETPGHDKEGNWLPAPKGTFSLFILSELPNKATLDRQWKPPIINRRE